MPDENIENAINHILAMSKDQYRWSLPKGEYQRASRNTLDSLLEITEYSSWVNALNWVQQGSNLSSLVATIKSGRLKRESVRLAELLRLTKERYQI